MLLLSKYVKIKNKYFFSFLYILYNFLQGIKVPKFNMSELAVEMPKIVLLRSFSRQNSEIVDKNFSEAKMDGNIPETPPCSAEQSSDSVP